MKILALESSGLAGSVAALDDARLLHQEVLDPLARSAKALAPACRDLLHRVGWTPADVQLIGVTRGPGSFTGLRVGVTMAKTWAYLHGAALVGVDTLQVLAEQTPPDCASVWTVLDAQRNELFVAHWRRDAPSGFLATRPTAIVSQGQWLQSLSAPAVVTGPGLAALVDRLPHGVRVVEESRWAPMAAAVGLVAARQFAVSGSDDPLQMVPLYLRRTAAEEQWDRRNA